MADWCQSYSIFLMPLSSAGHDPCGLCPFNFGDRKDAECWWAGSSKCSMWKYKIRWNGETWKYETHWVCGNGFHTEESAAHGVCDQRGSWGSILACEAGELSKLSKSKLLDFSFKTEHFFHSIKERSRESSSSLRGWRWPKTSISFARLLVPASGRTEQYDRVWLMDVHGCIYIYIYMDALYMAVSIKKKQKVMASCVVSECLW